MNVVSFCIPLVIETNANQHIAIKTAELSLSDSKSSINEVTEDGQHLDAGL